MKRAKEEGLHAGELHEIGKMNETNESSGHLVLRRQGGAGQPWKTKRAVGG
jgi:hypothetical protein